MFNNFNYVDLLLRLFHYSYAIVRSYKMLVYLSYFHVNKRACVTSFVSNHIYSSFSLLFKARLA